MDDRLEIHRLTRIGELLEAYPELEALLIEQAPAFSKLRNPVLRRTVARIATVEKAAAIAGIDPARLVATLRRAVGQSVGDERRDESRAPATETASEPDPPPWLDDSEIVERFDADALLEAGRVPLGPIARRARGLEGRQAVRVASTFYPAPLIEALESQGLRVFARQTGAKRFETFVARGGRDRDATSG